MTKVKAVLFDIDGTLVDSNERHVIVWEQSFAERGTPVPRIAIAPQIGKGGDLLVPTLFPGVSEDEVEAVSDLHGEIFKRDHLAHVRPFADAAALIRRVHEGGQRVGLATSAKQDELDHYVDLLGVGDIVGASVTTDDVDWSKPAKDIFAAALAKLGLTGDQVIAVGDTPYDIESAGKCGIATVALRSGGFDERLLRASGAAAVYADVAELLLLIDESPLRT